jgi:hypothetical protein
MIFQLGRVAPWRAYINITSKNVKKGEIRLNASYQFKRRFVSSAMREEIKQVNKVIKCKVPVFQVEAACMEDRSESISNSAVRAQTQGVHGTFIRARSSEFVTA